MSLDLKKTLEMVVHGNSKKAIPNEISRIRRKKELKPLDEVINEDPCNRDSQFYLLLNKSTLDYYTY